LPRHVENAIERIGIENFIEPNEFISCSTRGKSISRSELIKNHDCLVIPLTTLGRMIRTHYMGKDMRISSESLNLLRSFLQQLVSDFFETAEQVLNNDGRKTLMERDIPVIVEAWKIGRIAPRSGTRIYKASSIKKRSASSKKKSSKRNKQGFADGDSIFSNM